MEFGSEIDSIRVHEIPVNLNTKNMLSLIFIYLLLAYICLNALLRPHYGVIGYYGFILLQPEWNWRWLFSEAQGFQKYIVVATLIGLCIQKSNGLTMPRFVRLALGLLVIFIAIATLSYLQSIEQSDTYIYISSLWKIVLMVLIGVSVIDSPKKLLALMWVLVLSQGFNAYRINESYFLNGVCFFRTSGYGFGGDNNLYSILTIPIAAISASLALYSRRIWQKGLAATVVVLQIHQIMLMESRGTMVGAVCMFPIIVWYMPKSLSNIWGVCCASVLASILAGPPVVNEFLSSFADQETRDASADSRFLVWKAGLDIALDYPVLGVGPWAGQYLVPKYAGFEGERKGLHNLFFEILSGCGFPATLCYFGFFAIATWGAYTLYRRQMNLQSENWICCSALAAFTGLFGYMVSSIFSSGALLESSYAVAVLGLATMRVSFNLQLAGTDEETDSESDVSHQKSTTYDTGDETPENRLSCEF